MKMYKGDNVCTVHPEQIPILEDAGWSRVAKDMGAFQAKTVVKAVEKEVEAKEVEEKPKVAKKVRVVEKSEVVVPPVAKKEEKEGDLVAGGGAAVGAGPVVKKRRSTKK